ncbi:RecQ family ATP-dependent DNA helicase [Colwellia sp. 4_MG-2023]|uniref:RecQ family ATP-dependent DNA helicase n=1 Tax=unclassified Colwellia TaxID=196834 RepID=UPI0026E17BE7|nr:MULTISPECIES: RecQ family ATP-dependent DNA helicase [unclassified Colwellia]MDO6506229.1 RecQ family ATP-dependent DNA helicase [Colwellia sp. 5_MG-2023]MDO6554711.1 RecQ family ATP-dependent DNA helicase [Colwellia sp. 4_MG-2023]
MNGINQNSSLETLKTIFGFEQFRLGQKQTIEQLLAGQSTLSIFPTGSGKSLCYQLTALHLPNLTLVVSPLLALMKDQLAFLASKGITAASIDSTLKGSQTQDVMAAVRNGEIKILMVSVERFKNERFRQFIQSVPVSMLVVDEAHCISEWGHNFRPDYLKLPGYRKELNIPLTLLLTATATKKVKLDMADKFAINEHHIVQTGFYRHNLNLVVLPVSSANKNKVLVEQIQQYSNGGQNSGIVYVTLQHSAEQVAAYLQQSGINACAYHAGFDSENRSQIQADFMAGNIQVIVATIAFGMGIDKSDIRFVFHYDLPKSIENYSQEIGRAGRDGELSHCVTLANLDGLNTVENFVYGDTPELGGIESIIDNIKVETQSTQYESKWELQLLPLSNTSNIKQLPLKTLLVQLEIAGVIEPMYAYFADFKIKLLQPLEQILSGFNEQRRHFLSTVFKATAFKKVWGSLNFDTLLQDQSIDRNRVVAALEYLQEQQLIVLETSRMTEVFKVNSHELNDPKLATNLYNYFLDKEQKEIQRIAALVRFFQLDKCLSYNLSCYFDDKKAPVSCGHCSVCAGNVAQLEHSVQAQWPSDEVLMADAVALKSHLANKITVPLTLESYCRFFAGMSVPIFGRNKVRQLSGFASCEQQRYQAIRDKLSQLGAF